MAQGVMGATPRHVPTAWLTWGLIGACSLLFLAVQLSRLPLPGQWAWHQWLTLWPPGSPRFRLWQPLSYALLHGSWVHLLFNMAGLWLFGTELERRFGPLWLAEVFLASVLWAAIAHVMLSPLLHQSGSLIGASGGLYGLLVAYSVAFPRHRLPLLPGWEVRARTLALSYAALELYLLFPAALPGAAWLGHVMGNISHLAHVGGMAGGLMLAQRPQERAPTPPRR